MDKSKYAQIEEPINQMFQSIERRSLVIIKASDLSDRQVENVANVLTDQLWQRFPDHIDMLSRIVKSNKMEQQISNRLIEILNSVQGRLFTIIESFIPVVYQTSMKDIMYRAIWYEYSNVIEQLIKIIKK